MAVFSKSPPQFNANDVPGYLRQVDNYLRNMQESVDYAIGQLNSEMSGQASTIEAQGKAIKLAGDKVSDLEKRVKALEDGQK